MLQCPAPLTSAPWQVSPVLAVRVTVPVAVVGVEIACVTVKSNVTVVLTVEGLGELLVIAVVVPTGFTTIVTSVIATVV